jgi:hypothetical protein
VVLKSGIIHKRSVSNIWKIMPSPFFDNNTPPQDASELLRAQESLAEPDTRDTSQAHDDEWQDELLYGRHDGELACIVYLLVGPRHRVALRQSGGWSGKERN